MSFLDKIFKGLGFESDEKPSMPKQKKEEPKGVGQFDLRENSSEIMQKVFPKNITSLQEIVRYIKNNESIKVVLSDYDGEISEAYMFLCGAVYALGGMMRQVEEEIFEIYMQNNI